MRNIIFTSLSVLALAAPALAEVALREGCYIRDYSDAHLAAHPDQVVDWIRVRISHNAQYGDTYAGLDVLFADQGHVAGTDIAGQVLDQGLVCFEDGGGVGCAVDCDGGSFRVLKNDAKTLMFKTSTLWVGDTEGCGGAANIAEVMGQEVTYLLHRTDDAYCEGN